MKIDISKIEGYAEMSAEEKLAALEGFEVPDPDYTGYVKKEQFDKTASELSRTKKELQAKMTEDEKKAQESADAQKELQEKYDKLLYTVTVSQNKAELLALGYEEKLADSTAEAMAKGDLKTMFANQKKHLDSFEKKIKAEALKSTPKPGPDGDGGNQLTLEDFRKMTVAERARYATDHPEEYKELYTQEGKE